MSCGSLLEGHMAISMRKVDITHVPTMGCVEDMGLDDMNVCLNQESYVELVHGHKQWWEA